MEYQSFLDYLLVNSYYNPIKVINYLGGVRWGVLNEDTYIDIPSLFFAVLVLGSLIYFMYLLYAVNVSINIIKDIPLLIKIVAYWYIGYIIIVFPMSVYMYGLEKDLGIGWFKIILTVYLISGILGYSNYSGKKLFNERHQGR